MKILLDENINSELKKYLSGHNVYTVKDMKWLGKKNGELLKLAVENEFQILISNDTNIKYQQNLPKFQINILVLRTRGNDLDYMLPIMSKLIAVIGEIENNPPADKYIEVS